MLSAPETAVPFSQLNEQAKALLSKLASYQDPKHADFYPFLALMCLGSSEPESSDDLAATKQIPEEDLIALSAELLHLAFKQKQNFKDALKRPDLFCIALMAILLRSENGPFNFEKREALLKIAPLDANPRTTALKTAFADHKEFLTKLLMPLYFEVLRTPDVDGAKPAKELNSTFFISQFLGLIKLRLKLILSEDNFSDRVLGFIKSELNYLDSENYFNFLAEELEYAIQGGSQAVTKPSSLVKLQEIHDKWNLMMRDELIPLYERVEELSAFGAYMAQKFPKSPIRADFDAFNKTLRECYSGLLATLGDFELSLDYIREKIASTNQTISELIDSEKNRLIGGETPLHRLAKETPKKEEEAKHIHMLMHRLKKEGADSKVTTKYYVRRWPTLIYDVVSRFPWPNNMAKAYYTNPERDALGVSQTALLSQALQDKPEQKPLSFSLIDTVKGVLHLKSVEEKKREEALQQKVSATTASSPRL